MLICYSMRKKEREASGVAIIEAQVVTIWSCKYRDIYIKNGTSTMASSAASERLSEPKNCR